ncbi:zonula occludens toxin (Zot) family protein [Campylobacter pinnipediorum subsp. caledonicus]|uniref:zonular occludens toxin domain-containing protein n=1 Tax=Campylobacter pinnipediorum TaxID=1965231 RepID=UPI00099511B7|nr:zonular occludens toxin domain-containing protein [Campylobacter pinnipediorum]AQW85868.1 zonula occludens toxin (Zot) family protein [Campylobacter pinnipediorum subsp. caledonicus]
MISYIIGNPGSGKTYYAVNRIYETFLKQPEKSFFYKFKKDKKETKKQDEFYFCYTNIDGFKFDLDNRFKPFDFNKFYDDISILYACYLDKKGDKHLIEIAKQYNLFKVLIILDEAHNFFKNKKDEVLIWWLTYHRHLSQEIYLITQDLSLINPEYKRIAEFFYKAVDSSKRVFTNKLRYILYGSYKLYAKDEYRKINIDFSKDVFNLYHSGKIKNQSSLIKKFFSISLFLLFVLVIIFYFVIDSMTDDTKKDNTNDVKTINNIDTKNYNLSNNSKNKIIKKYNKSDNDLENLYLYNITCIDSNCFIKKSDIEFPKSFLEFIISRNSALYFTSFQIGSFTNYFFAFKSPVFDVLNSINKGSKDEKDYTNTSLFK